MRLSQADDLVGVLCDTRADDPIVLFGRAAGQAYIDEGIVAGHVLAAPDVAAGEFFDVRFKLRQQRAHSGLDHCGSVLCHGGEPVSSPFGLGYIVKADDADAFRHAQTQSPAQCVDGIKSHVIAGNKSRVGPLVGRVVPWAWAGT